MKGIKYYTSVLVITIVALMVAQKFGFAFPIVTRTQTAPTELKVVGEGKVEVVPDTGYVTLGVRVDKRETAAEIQSEMNKSINSVTAAIEKLGISSKNIKTTNYSVYPEYDYNSDNRGIIGYSGSASISVKTKGTELLSKVIATGTAAGANEIQNTSFGVDDPGKYRSEARAKAIQNAKDEAEKMAKSLGIRLGKVVNIVESNDQGMVNAPYLSSAKMEGGGGGEMPDLSQGTQTITSVVTLYFEKR
ncbi:MAG: SIMPL domain-containing protein [Candidatus Roizmanbacteria bacterium]|nr:SIMPL domain-containing protein [Candidatus Roizmanbacteria bacterium]